MYEGVKIIWMCGVAVNMSPCHGEDREFDSRHIRHYGGLAQLGEHLPCKQNVVGSSPITSTIFMIAKVHPHKNLD